MFSITTSGGFMSCTGGSSSQPNLQNSSLNESSNTTNSQQSTSSKRRNDDDNSGPPDDGDGARRNKRPKRSNLTEGSARTRRLACPYFQRNHEKHLRGACSGPGFEDMSKLKDHLKRTHSKPFRCPRCQEEIFPKTQLEQHLDRVPRCEKRPLVEDDRVSDELMSELRKVHTFASARTQEAKWNILYQKLFPNDTVIPSPFYSYQGIPAGGLEEFKSYFNAELPALLSREIEAELGEEMKPVVQQLKQKLPDLIRRCYIRLCRDYPPSATPLPRTAPSSALSSESQVSIDPTKNCTLAPIPESLQPNHDGQFVEQFLGQADFNAGHQNPIASSLFEVEEERDTDFEWIGCM